MKLFIAYILWFREWYCHKKEKRWKWFPRAEDDPKFSWQRCFTLVLISRLKMAFFFPLCTFTHHGVLYPATGSRFLSSMQAEHKIILLLCFSSEDMAGWESILLLVSPVFFSKSDLFAFSYAMVRGMITSWQETSHQLEASYLWQLLSNCCPRTVNPSSLPSAPH